MPSAPSPSNEVLAEMIRGLKESHEQSHQYIKDQLEDLNKKVGIQNGRVRKNELKIALGIGGFIVVNAVGVPILINWFSR